MKNTARLGNHPIHPMLIPYPFAFLSGAMAFDLASAAKSNTEYARTAAHLRGAGLATALVAALPGLVDYLTAVPAGRPRATATRHLLSNVGALACFAAAGLGRRRTRPSTASTLALELAGAALLSAGGWLGGSLVYTHHIGTGDVAPPTTTERPRLVAGSGTSAPM
jgi:uncharacterized membrane protein